MMQVRDFYDTRTSQIQTSYSSGESNLVGIVKWTDQFFENL